jgi:hypothetical protein
MLSQSHLKTSIDSHWGKEEKRARLTRGVVVIIAEPAKASALLVVVVVGPKRKSPAERHGGR